MSQGTEILCSPKLLFCSQAQPVLEALNRKSQRLDSIALGQLFSAIAVHVLVLASILMTGLNSASISSLLPEVYPGPCQHWTATSLKSWSMQLPPKYNFLSCIHSFNKIFITVQFYRVFFFLFHCFLTIIFSFGT